MRCSMRSPARPGGLRMTERSVGELHGGVEAPEGGADKHHRVMASASRIPGFREQEGWCLPASLDTVELRDQRSRTRGLVDLRILIQEEPAISNPFRLMLILGEPTSRPWVF
jgi:hypothetical protein